MPYLSCTWGRKSAVEAIELKLLGKKKRKRKPGLEVNLFTYLQNNIFSNMAHLFCFKVLCLSYLINCADSASCFLFICLLLVVGFFSPQCLRGMLGSGMGLLSGRFMPFPTLFWNACWALAVFQVVNITPACFPPSALFCGLQLQGLFVWVRSSRDFIIYCIF